MSILPHFTIKAGSPVVRNSIIHASSKAFANDEKGKTRRAHVVISHLSWGHIYFFFLPSFLPSRHSPSSHQERETNECHFVPLAAAALQLQLSSPSSHPLLRRAVAAVEVDLSAAMQRLHLPQNPHSPRPPVRPSVLHFLVHLRLPPPPPLLQIPKSRMPNSYFPPNFIPFPLATLHNGRPGGNSMPLKFLGQFVGSFFVRFRSNFRPLLFMLSN